MKTIEELRDQELRKSILISYISTYDLGYDLGIESIGDSAPFSLAEKLCDLCSSMTIEDICYHFMVAAEIMIDKYDDNIFDCSSFVEQEKRENELIDEFKISAYKKLQDRS